MHRFTRHLAACALMFLAGTAAAEDDVAAALDGTAWVLSDLAGHTLLPGTPATLRLTQGRLTGSDGCNRFSGSYEAQADAFRVAGDLAGTRMACAEPVMQQPQALVNALREARRAQIEDGRLALLDERGTLLAAFTAQSSSLAGTAWRVTGYNNGKQAVVSPLLETLLTIEFSTDGRVAGSAGCHRYMGSYRSEGGKVVLSQLATTRRVCATPDGVMEQEQVFLGALQGAALMRIEADRLELRDAGDAIAVIATRSQSSAQSRALRNAARQRRRARRR
jgi:heat shock protein HslJ